jgi:hypothetical protein
MHTPDAALDDNEGTYWSPGRDEAIAAGIPGRRFDHFRLMPKDPLWLKSGWLEVDLGRVARVGRAVLMEKIDARSYLPVTAWKIEYATGAGWQSAVEGTAVGRHLEVTFPRPVDAARFRLTIDAPGRPAIAEFQLLPPE